MSSKNNVDADEKIEMPPLEFPPWENITSKDIAHVLREMKDAKKYGRNDEFRTQAIARGILIIEALLAMMPTQKQSTGDGLSETDKKLMANSMRLCKVAVRMERERILRAMDDLDKGRFSHGETNHKVVMAAVRKIISR